MLSRTGQGKPLTLLVNDSGTIRCDGGKAKSLPDPMLLEARDLADDLNKDAQSKLHVPPAGPDSVFSYRITLQDGTLAFSDTAARGASRARPGGAVRRAGRAEPLRAVGLIRAAPSAQADARRWTERGPARGRRSQAA